MATEFKLSGNRLSKKKWNRLLQDWAGRQDVTIYDEPVFDDSEDPLAFVWGKGSIRGALFTLRKKEKCLVLRLSELASRTDWTFGYEILNLALEMGGGILERESGEIHGPDRLTGEQAREDGAREFCADLNRARGLLEQKKDVYLPLGPFLIKLSPGDLPPCTPETMGEVEQELAWRVQKYATAYRAGIILVGSNQRVSNWALIPTVVQETDYISLEWKGNIFVPVDRLRAILGDRAEDLGSGLLYLPGLDQEKDLPLLQELERENAGPEIFKGEPVQLDPSALLPGAGKGGCLGMILLGLFLASLLIVLSN